MSIIEFIRDRSRYYNCPVCGRSLRGCSVRMLNHVDDRFTVQVTCAACQVTFIVVLAIQGAGLEAAMDGELEIGDELEEMAEAQVGAARPPGAGPIEPDELLDVHLLLKNLEGPFDELLREPHPRR